MSITKGEYRVGINFNPSDNDTVFRIKRAAADLIDMIEEIDAGILVASVWGECPTISEEKMRLKAFAQTHIGDGAMWAVKAATKREPEGMS